MRLFLECLVVVWVQFFLRDGMEELETDHGMVVCAFFIAILSVNFHINRISVVCFFVLCIKLCLGGMGKKEIEREWQLLLH